jgi:hypothetical protein
MRKVIATPGLVAIPGERLESQLEAMLAVIAEPPAPE